MPLYQRLPKRGFVNIFAKVVGQFNIGTLQAAIDSKRLSASKKITRKELVDAGLVRKNVDAIKLLGQGELKTAC